MVMILGKTMKNQNTKFDKVLREIKTLQCIIPICASCKKIRDDKGNWNYMEFDVKRNSHAAFSHGMCPECSDKFYGNEDWYKKMKENREIQ